MSSVSLGGPLHAVQSEELCTDLNQIVVRSESSILDAVAADVSARFALSPNVAWVAVSAGDLQRIVVALCAEAGSALGSGGRLVVETRGVNDAQVVAEPMADSAVEARARVIVSAEPPVQPMPHALSQGSAVSADTRHRAAGVEALLAQLGGRLELVSRPDGAVAYVAHLPHASPPNSSGRMPVAVAHGAQLILLVEDEPQVQAVTSRILRAFGYSVITAHNERTALAQAELYGAAISLVVSDLLLPGVSGTDLVRRLQKPCEHARVLYISGYSPEHVGASVQDASFLRKPFTAEELVTAVRELLIPSVH